MASNMVLNGAVGALFGASVTAAGVYKRSVIFSQLRLEDFHMLTVFLVATGCSAYVFFQTLFDMVLTI